MVNHQIMRILLACLCLLPLAVSARETNVVAQVVAIVTFMAGFSIAETTTSNDDSCSLGFHGLYFTTVMFAFSLAERK